MPNTPTGVAATRKSDTQVDVTWNPDLDSEGFEVHRSTDGFVYNFLANQGATAAFSYSDTTAPVGTKYWYKVRIYNSFGYSQFSTPATNP